ncbi:hypothetical protein Tcan_13953 [Toxocara canis]|uniref:Uncharacterized protein n=1 Tax=Toxocara canis TaxID=6265 RepID=A0A0B2VAS9_TOXCA|nr:hypothetical protein Tcan_13953 [Toxocara canis]
MTSIGCMRLSCKDKTTQPHGSNVYVSDVRDSAVMPQTIREKWHNEYNIL